MSKQQQQQQLLRWKLLPKWHRLTVFQRLFDNEFQSIPEHDQRVNRRLSAMVAFAAQHVPYYQAQFSRLGISASSVRTVEDLARLPVLDRASVQAHTEALKSRILPAGELIGGTTKTSGSTGQPVEVLHTQASLRFFSFLKQREYRWWSMDPQASFAMIRPAVDLPAKNGSRLKDGDTLTLAAWPLVSNFFYTGRALALNDTNSADAMVDWLHHHKPLYLIAMAAVLEQIALGVKDIGRSCGLQQALSISQQLTPGMRSLVESRLVPGVNENYGLNEIGLVASRCPMSGYYHVHSEHCVVEIVDPQGRQCEPGQSGRLLITALNNPAMPLIRYDADDLAEIPIEPCGCGRGLPSFTNLRGRYRRTAHLPEGTWNYWGSLLDVLGDAQAQEIACVKQYQLHQRDKDLFDLNLVIQGDLPTTLVEKIYRHWNAVEPDSPAILRIHKLESITQAGKKFQNFVSDVAPPED